MGPHTTYSPHNRRRKRKRTLRALHSGHALRLLRRPMVRDLLCNRRTAKPQHLIVLRLGGGGLVRVDVHVAGGDALQIAGDALLFHEIYDRLRVRVLESRDFVRRLEPESCDSLAEG